MSKKIRSGGFVLIEFAIALPLLILVMYGLANVGAKIFELGKIQLADYVLESEARYVMERITQEARAAKEIKSEPYTDEIHKLKIVCHTIDEDKTNNVQYVDDILETQFFILNNNKLYAKRTDSKPTTPITGDNFFGETKINTLQYDLDESKKILHIKLEMESLASAHKIKIATAVFMPGYEVPSDE